MKMKVINTLNKSLFAFNKFNFCNMPKVPLKIVRPAEIEYSKPNYDQPLCVFPKSSLIKLTPKGHINITQKGITYSSYKLNEALFPIRQKYLQDAIAILTKMNSKGAQIVLKKLKTFQESVKDKKPKDCAFYDYVIAEAFVGRKLDHKKIIYRAKGNVTFIRGCISSYTLRIKKIKSNEVLQQVAQGERNTNIVHMMRSLLFTKKADLKTIQNYSFITTSKGRNIQRTQIKRYAGFLKDQFIKKRGIHLSNEILLKYIKSRLGKSLEANSEALLNLQLSPEQIDVMKKFGAEKSDFIQEKDKKFELAKVDKSKERSIHYQNTYKNL